MTRKRRRAPIILGVLALMGSLVVSAALAQTTATGTATVKVAQSKLGRILVDGNGRTLYLWTSDKPNKSYCSSDFGCPAYWPPLLTSGKPHAGTGVNAHLLGTIHRTKPSGVQVTYHGHPLYYDAADTKPGDTKGQGQINAWYVVSPTGSPIKKK